MSLESGESGNTTPLTENQTLTKPGYWNEFYEGDTEATVEAPVRPTGPAWLRRLLPERYVDVILNGYSRYLIDKVALVPHFPVRRDWRVLEVGSAPGHNLVDFHRRFGYVPYGIEYTDTGVELKSPPFPQRGLGSRKNYPRGFLFRRVSREISSPVRRGLFIWIHRAFHRRQGCRETAC